MNFARGCGAMTMALRPFTALMLFMTGVASGLVEGDSAPIEAGLPGLAYNQQWLLERLGHA